MFGKLMKYELRSVMKNFAFLWVGILVLSVVNAFTLDLGDTMDGMAAFFAFVLPLLVLFALYVAAFVIALLYVLQRFYHGLLGDEGYLMFTLPVTAGQLVGAKALTALILEVVSVLVALIGGLVILFVQLPPDTWGFTLEQVWQELVRAIGESPLVILVAVEFVLLMLLRASQTNLQLYAGMSLGHLAKKNRVAWSAAAVVGISIAVSMVSGWLGNAFGQVNMNFDLLDLSYGSGVQAAAVLLGLACLWSLVLNVIYFFASRAILTRKLNLE